MRKFLAALAFLAALIPAVVSGQQFPLTLPANSVYGRLGVGTGPGQAIPFSVLAAQPSLVSRGLGVGATPIVGATNRYGLYNNNGFLGQSPRTLWATDAPYGALCNGATDDSAAFNLLIADAIATGWPARFRGACKASFTISNSVDFGGVLGLSLLIPATAGTVGISINTPNAVYLHDFEISHSAYGGASSGVAGITVTATGTENGFSTFSNLILDFGFYGINFQRASSWTLVNTKITNSVDSCVLVQNLNVADSGDSSIDNIACTPGGAAVAGIRFLSSSGLRIINSKINGTNLPVGISVELPASTVLADLFVTGNSIELHSTTGSGIKFTRTGAASFLGNVHIVGNEFGLLLKCVDIPTDGTGPWLQAVAIAANSCIMVNSATAVAYNIDATTTFNVSGGVAQSFNAGTKVYVIGSQATKGVLLPVAKLGTFAADTIAANSIEGAINAGGPVMANYTANAAALAAAGFTAGIPNAKAATASFPILTAASNDASNPLQLQISMGTHATAGSRSIDFNIVEPTVAYRQFNLAASLVNLSQGGLQSFTFLQTGTTTVGSLPACGAGTKGQRYFVTDANSTTFHATAVGGGANNMGVTCDGTNWYISANDNDPFWASRKFA